VRGKGPAALSLSPTCLVFFFRCQLFFKDGSRLPKSALSTAFHHRTSCSFDHFCVARFQNASVAEPNPASWPLSTSVPTPQNTSALRSTVKNIRCAGHDDRDTHSFYPGPPSSKFLPPSGRWMNPMMIRPIDSSYSASQTSSDSQFALLPSPFPPYPMHAQHPYPSLPPLPPILSEQNVVHPDYYHPTPPCSESSSTSPSSMSSRSIETLDSPVSLQSQQPSHTRYQHQHHHSEPYIYTATSGYTPDDPFHMSRGSAPFQNSQYMSQNVPYAPFVVPLGPEVYGASHAGKPPPTIEAFNSTLVSSGSIGRRKHRMSFSAGGSGELEFFPHGAREPRSTQRTKAASSRMNAVSPYRRGSGAQRASTGPGPSVPLQLMGEHESSSFLMLEMPSSAVPFPSSTPAAPKPAVVHPFRTLPDSVQIDPQFPLLYRKFYVPSYFAPQDPLGKFVFAEK
jgi:hypothetical protein